jgi:hypothetical protein
LFDGSEDFDNLTGLGFFRSIAVILVYTGTGVGPTKPTGIVSVAIIVIVAILSAPEALAVKETILKVYVPES